MAEGQESGEYKRRSLIERSRQWFLTIGTVLDCVAGIIGFLCDSVGVVEFVRNMGASPSPTELATPVESPTSAAPETATAVAMATATAVVTPSPTPLPVMAAQNERLLLVAQFSNF